MEIENLKFKSNDRRTKGRSIAKIEAAKAAALVAKIRAAPFIHQSPHIIGFRDPAQNAEARYKANGTSEDDRARQNTISQSHCCLRHENSSRMSHGRHLRP